MTTGNLNSHGARPVHQTITMIKWIRTSRLSIKNSFSDDGRVRDLGQDTEFTTLQYRYRKHQLVVNVSCPRKQTSWCAEEGRDGCVRR